MDLAIHAPATKADVGRAGPAGRIRRGLWRSNEWKRNARSREYMEALAGEVGAGRWHVVDGDAGLTDAMIRDASRIVLLWPDANGSGSGEIGRRVARLKTPTTPVYVLNGRRRHFELTPRMRRRFALRRLLQRFWAGEAVWFAAALMIGLPLTAWDLLRGRT
jgi:hypothetical protein